MGRKEEDKMVAHRQPLCLLLRGLGVPVQLPPLVKHLFWTLFETLFFLSQIFDITFQILDIICPPQLLLLPQQLLLRLPMCRPHLSSSPSRARPHLRRIHEEMNENDEKMN